MTPSFRDIITTSDLYYPLNFFRCITSLLFRWKHLNKVSLKPETSRFKPKSITLTVGTKHLNVAFSDYVAKSGLNISYLWAAMKLEASELLRYFDVLKHLLCSAVATDLKNQVLDYAAAIEGCINQARRTHANGRKLIFIGNGGSAAIASHMATDYSKNGGLRAMAMNDSATLTCLSNDLGYENVFAKQIDMLANEGDLLIAISSSGKSLSILRAVEKARERGCSVISLSGFGAENPLRKTGDTNFYVASDQYGYVEIAHLAICHAILDFSCGLVPPTLPAV